MFLESNLLQNTTLADATHADWYAIYTRHQHEKVIAQTLATKGFETFLPLAVSPHQWKDRTKIVSVALFPCYVFLKGDVEHGRLKILTTPGVHSLVSSAGQPAAIPAIQIETIRHALEKGARLQPHPFLKCGDIVRVKRGALEGVEGILVRKKNLCRLVLTIEMLGRSAFVEVEAAQVEKLYAGRLAVEAGSDPGTCRAALSRNPRLTIGPL
jgi:transcription antitermination factor NusG